MIAEKDHREHLNKPDEAIEESEVNIFPNPAKDAMEIRIPDYEGKVNIKLINMQGHLIKVVETGKQTMKLKIPDVPEGLYFLHLELEGTSTIQKVQVID